MKLEYKSSERNSFNSILVKRSKEPFFGYNWHYHDEFELLFTFKGSGVRIVGDYMDHFSGVSLVLNGPNLPHLWRNNEDESEVADIDAVVVKFPRQINGLALFSLPELFPIRLLLDRSHRGLLFSKHTQQKVKKSLIQLNESDGPDRIILFLEVLKLLAEDKNTKELATEGFILPTTLLGKNRLKTVIDYISENYTNEINLKDLADLSAMTTNSFCRFFKSRTSKTATQFIGEYRINKACQLLIDGEKSISEICDEVGFNSFSSFNRVFKQLKQVSPGEYKAKYQSDLLKSN